MKIFKSGALLIGFMILLASCDSTAKYEKEEIIKIQNYLAAHPEYNFVLKPSGLYYADVILGTGLQPVTHDTAFVIYTGYYLNGTPFGTNVGFDTLKYPVNENYFLPGFEEGVMYMKAGGTARILLNSDLGYGNSGYMFPAYTPTVFDLKLVRVIPGPGK